MLLHVIRVPRALDRASLLRRLNVDEAAYRDPAARSYAVVDDVDDVDVVSDVDPNPAPDTTPPVVVLGLSNKLHDLVRVDEARRDGVSVVRRFTGGGTVALDRDAVLVSIVGNTKRPYPREVLEWTASEVYGPALGPLLRAGLDFGARENDYVVGGAYKVGGNAQALSLNPGRFLHHTSFLWRVNARTMSYLRPPTKRPEYRGTRDHLDFLRGLEDVVHERATRRAFVDAVVASLARAWRATDVIETDVDDERVPRLGTEPRSRVEELGPGPG